MVEEGLVEEGIPASGVALAPTLFVLVEVLVQRSDGVLPVPGVQHSRRVLAEGLPNVLGLRPSADSSRSRCFAVILPARNVVDESFSTAS